MTVWMGGSEDRSREICQSTRWIGMALGYCTPYPILWILVSRESCMKAPLAHTLLTCWMNAPKVNLARGRDGSCRGAENDRCCYGCIGRSTQAHVVDSGRVLGDITRVNAEKDAVEVVEA